MLTLEMNEVKSMDNFSEQTKNNFHSKFFSDELDRLVKIKETIDCLVELRLKQCGCDSCNLQYFDLFGKPLNDFDRR